MSWSDYDINLIHNYPDAGAAPEHRNLVIDNFLGEKERVTIRKILLEKNNPMVYFLLMVPRRHFPTCLER